jgi:hypothetical protein
MRIVLRAYPKTRKNTPVVWTMYFSGRWYIIIMEANDDLAVTTTLLVHLL